ncbi:MAG: hypothetical protein K2X45_21750 [Phreatobacter sp.]|nr:hypothetical protein [Phreatobacter sp.]
MPRRRVTNVSLPTNVCRVRGRNGKDYFYYQERRGQRDAGPRVRLPYEPRDPDFWKLVATLSTGHAGPTAGSFDALISHYQGQSCFRSLSLNSQKSYRIALAHISKAWGSLSVRELAAKHVYALQERHSDRKAMANLILRVLSVLLREGVRADYCAFNVARDVQKLRENPNGAAPWSDETFAFVLAHAPSRLMRAVLLGRATGQRAVDLVRMRPADLHGDGINVLVQKLNQQRHWCPVSKDALRVITDWNEQPMLPFLHKDGRFFNEDRLREEWRAWKLSNPAVPAEITLHDLRANAVCDRRLAGVPHQQIVDQLCMSPAMVVRYSKHIDRALNAQQGMATLERAQNSQLQNLYSPAAKRHA